MLGKRGHHGPRWTADRVLSSCTSLTPFCMRKTIRGSIVGTRLDLAECLQFAGDGKVKVHYSTERLEDINSIFGRMRDNKIDGRVVMKI